MNERRVSVVLCTYNGERFIERQIGSILTQTRPVDELVLADDGSRDRTVQIVRSCLSGSGVSLLELRAQSVPLGATRNFDRGLRASTGDLLFLADQDDIWLPSRVAATLSAFDRDPDLLLHTCDAQIIDETGQSGGTLLQSMGLSPSSLAVSTAALGELFMRRSVFPGMAMAVDRRLVERVTPIPECWPHDYWLCLTASMFGAFGFSSEKLVQYRQHASNLVGARAPGRAAQIRRLLSSGSDASRLSLLFDTAFDRLKAVDGLPAGSLNLLEGKAAFERRRLQMNPSLVRRIPEIVRLLVRADGYSLYSSNRRLHATRDLIFRPTTAA